MLFMQDVMIILKSPSKICRRWHFQICVLLFKENKSWHLMWIFYLTDNSHEMSRLFSQKIKKKNSFECRLLQIFLAGALRVNMYEQEKGNLYVWWRCIWTAKPICAAVWLGPLSVSLIIIALNKALFFFQLKNIDIFLISLRKYML